MSVLNKLKEKLFSELRDVYAFWVFRWIDCLGFGVGANRLRAKLLAWAGFDLGSGCSVGTGVYIHSTKTPIKIGNNVTIGRNIYFDAPNLVTIGNCVTIGNGTKFVNSSHELQSDFKILRPNISMPPILVEDAVYIGSNVLILGGVTLGEGCVIESGSIVTKSIPPHCFAQGVPAKVVDKRAE
ncbi:MAG: acyltransferase [Vampirovibrio sp.]|nr:acyltransferase [Vampirovibrio sp.]